MPVEVANTLSSTGIFFAGLGDKAIRVRMLHCELKWEFPMLIYLNVK